MSLAWTLLDDVPGPPGNPFPGPGYRRIPAAKPQGVLKIPLLPRRGQFAHGEAAKGGEVARDSCGSPEHGPLGRLFHHDVEDFSGDIDVCYDYFIGKKCEEVALLPGNFFDHFLGSVAIHQNFVAYFSIDLENNVNLIRDRF
jgi:hypothetical protein